jgi:hypothetical protein
MRRVASICSWPGCRALAPPGQARCPEHVSNWGRWGGPKDYGPDWSRIRDQVIREEPWCACGAPSTEAGHKVSLSQGGTHARSNLFGQCHECNQRDALARSVEVRKSKAKQ